MSGPVRLPVGNETRQGSPHVGIFARWLTALGGTVDRQLLDDIFLFISIIVGMGCLTGVIITFLKRRGRALPSDLTGRLDDIANRLNRLDTSIDTIAVEVERISEAQRFTAKVLADRSGGSALSERSRSGPVTPH